MTILKLTGSVGKGSSKRGIPHNVPEDVKKVRDRFILLGFSPESKSKWLTKVTKGDERNFIKLIRVFQSATKGSGQANKGDGRIDLKGDTHRWLAAENAPGWVRIYGGSGLGWACMTPENQKENGGYGTSWLLKAINTAGFDYALNNCKFGTRTTPIPIISPLLNIGIPSVGLIYPPMWVHECSTMEGGDAKGHKSHETGIDVDMRLPLLSPHQGEWTNLGHKGYEDSRFDEVASEEQLKSIKKSMNAKYVFFNDPAFIRQGLCRHTKGHNQHYHIRIKPPRRVEGVYQ